MQRALLLLGFLGGNLVLGWCALDEWESSTRKPAVRESIQPCLQFASYRIELGRIPVGESREFSTTVRNASGQPVKVERVLTSCGCTDVKIVPDYLPPDATAELKGRVSPRFSAGELLVKVTPISTSNSQPRSIEVAGTIVSNIEAFPRILVVEPTLGDSGVEATCQFRNHSRKAVVLAATSQLPFGIALRPSSAMRIPAGGRATLTVRASYADPLVRRINLRFRTGLPEEPLIELSLNVRPCPSLRMSPSQIDFGVLSRAEFSRRKEVTIQFTGDVLRRLKVARIEAPNIVASHRFFMAKSAAAAQLHLEFTKAPTHTSLDSNIVIWFTSVGVTNQIRAAIPVSGLLTDPVVSHGGVNRDR